MESSDTVRSVFEKDGKLFVSFRRRAAYYHVPLRDAALCAKIREAFDGKKEIFFTHDGDLQISSIRLSAGTR
jgi:hypothetical protein